MRLTSALAAAVLMSWTAAGTGPAAASDGVTMAQNSPTAASARQRRVLRVGPSRDLRTPSAAARLARDGDHVIIDPGTYRDCAVWRASDLILEGDSRGKPHLTGPVCDDQAIWLVRGNNVRVINIEFSGAHSSVYNGAGVKMVGTNLLVRNSRFLDNENGILTAGRPRSLIIVTDSRFEGNGICRKDCAHGLYAGRVYQLVVRNSRFVGQKQGHHIKSRAYNTLIIGNTIADGADGTASMSIDLPNGGNADIAYNNIEKGPMAENHRMMISIGEESRPTRKRPNPMSNPSQALIFRNNVFTNRQPKTMLFIRNLTGTPVTLRGNRFIGPGRHVSGPYRNSPTKRR